MENLQQILIVSWQLKCTIDSKNEELMEPTGC